jgi:hypothetical protein
LRKKFIPSVWQPGIPAEQSINEFHMQLAAYQLIPWPQVISTDEVPKYTEEH